MIENQELEREAERYASMAISGLNYTPDAGEERYVLETFLSALKQVQPELPRLKCIQCGKGANDLPNGYLQRINVKGLPAIWICTEHLNPELKQANLPNEITATPQNVEPTNETRVDSGGRLAQAYQEITELKDKLNSPELRDFAQGAALEAAHQRERWGSSHDAGKEPQDWFWLVGYLSGKALRAHIDGDIPKALHHTISSAAALNNWHAAISGTNREMRPGISAERQREAVPSPDKPEPQGKLK